MKDMIVDLFGQYTPVTYSESFVYTAADGSVMQDVNEVVASGLAGVDWPWVAGVFLFAIVLYSLFRLLGVFFK